jgi:hypothetical protein
VPLFAYTVAATVRIILNVNGGVEMGYIFIIDWTGRDVGLPINMLLNTFLVYRLRISLNFGYLSTVDLCGLTC